MVLDVSKAHFACGNSGRYITDVMFLVFINGLDEYEADHQTMVDLIDIIKGLGSAPDVKLSTGVYPAALVLCFWMRLATIPT